MSASDYMRRTGEGDRVVGLPFDLGVPVNIVPLCERFSRVERIRARTRMQAGKQPQRTSLGNNLTSLQPNLLGGNEWTPRQ